MKKALSPEDKDRLRLARVLEPMRRSEGWRVYSELLKAHKDNHVNSILSATTDIPGIFAGERDKGAAAGIQLAMNLVNVICEEAEAIRKQSGDTDDDD